MIVYCESMSEKKQTSGGACNGKTKVHWQLPQNKCYRKSEFAFPAHFFCRIEISQIRGDESFFFKLYFGSWKRVHSFFKSVTGEDNFLYAIMKFPGIWVFLFVVGAALVAFTFSSNSSIPGDCCIGSWFEYYSPNAWLLTPTLVYHTFSVFILWIVDLPAVGFLNVIPGMGFLQHGTGGTRATGTSRRLKGIGDGPGNEKQSNVDMEDYHPIDPVPSSKASIKPGPIEHGSPLIPYIPKPSPPGNPRIGGSI
ncbi:hypothetical protein GQ457_03G041000 [Hibiscus cannabinus]